MPNAGLKVIQGSIVLYLQSTLLVVRLIPYLRHEVLAARYTEQMVIDKIVHYYKNMFRHLKNYFAHFVNL